LGSELNVKNYTIGCISPLKSVINNFASLDFTNDSMRIEEFINKVVKSGKKWLLVVNISLYLKSKQIKEFNLIQFSEEYECKADSKGRIMVPSSLRSKLAPVISDGLVLKRSIFQKCLEVYTMAA